MDKFEGTHLPERGTRQTRSSTSKPSDLTASARSMAIVGWTTASPRVYAILAITFCGLIGLYDVLYISSLIAGGPSIGPIQHALWPDFLTPYAAVRAYFEGKLAIVYDFDAFSSFHDALFADRPHLSGFRPFLYPPTWILLLLPLGLLTIDVAFVVFMVVTMGASVIESRRDLVGWLAVATSPAAVWAVVSGQNSFLLVALLYGGLRFLDRAPAISGILLGMLVYKPQILVLVPIALVASRQWRALSWATATVIVLSLVSLQVFGIDCWIAFLEMARHSSGPRMVDYVVNVLGLVVITPFVSALRIGLPQDIASILQFSTAALAVVSTWIAFRHYSPSAARTAVLIAGTLLVSPYLLNYDLLLLMPVALALYRQGALEGFRHGEPLVYAALWVIPTLCRPLGRHDLPITPLIILAFFGFAMARLLTQPRIKT